MNEENHRNNSPNAEAVYKDMKYLEGIKNELEQLRPSSNPIKEVLSYFGSMALFFGFLIYLDIDGPFYTVYLALFIAISITQSMTVAESKKTNKRIDLLKKLVELQK